MRNIERYYGLDRPILAQYATTMWNYLRGDFGPSWYHRDRRVHDLIWPAFRVSILLGTLSFFIAIVIGIPIGILAAAKQNRFADHAAMSVAIGGICVPNFLLGPLLKMTLVFWIKLLPVSGWPANGSPWELSRLILPSVTLAMVHVAYISRLMRAGMLDVLRQDYIRTARAKGLAETGVILRHGLKNGVTPVLTYAGPMAALIVTGSMVVERIFGIPGLGLHFVNSALNRDLPLLMGATLVFSTLVIFFNLLVDLTYAWLDPRVRVH
jgi:oligopeptide transport system permease protein